MKITPMEKFAIPTLHRPGGEDGSTAGDSGREYSTLRNISHGPVDVARQMQGIGSSAVRRWRPGPLDLILDGAEPLTIDMLGPVNELKLREVLAAPVGPEPGCEPVEFVGDQ